MIPLKLLFIKWGIASVSTDKINCPYVCVVIYSFVKISSVNHEVTFYSPTFLIHFKGHLSSSFKVTRSSVSVFEVYWGYWWAEIQNHIWLIVLWKITHAWETWDSALRMNSLPILDLLFEANVIDTVCKIATLANTVIVKESGYLFRKQNLIIFACLWYDWWLLSPVTKDSLTNQEHEQFG